MGNRSKIEYAGVSLGCDPEFFFATKNRGLIRGSERIIPKNGLEHGNGGRKMATRIIVDGVQAELNPAPSTCRAYLGNDIRSCFIDIAEAISRNNDLKVSFESVVRVSKKELENLSDKAKTFGCAPSFNNYLKTKKKISKIDIDPSEYRYRSAGGHVHIGCDTKKKYKNALGKNISNTVNIFDILLGIPCVLIDRNPLSKERRKVYGRAGEYRLPVHGFEYRTLSNFWLRAYPLTSFVLSMARFAMAVAISDEEVYNYLIQDIKMQDVGEAINDNDFNDAMAIFNKTQSFYNEYCDIPRLSTTRPLVKNFVPLFKYFADVGIEHWFNHDILEHWMKLPEGHDGGWESFMEKRVLPEFNELSAARKKRYGSTSKKIKILLDSVNDDDD